MSNTFTLDSMKEELQKEFAPCVIELSTGESVTLRNLLRVPKKARDAVYPLLDELTELQKTNDDKKDDEKDSLSLVETEKTAEIAVKILGLVADPAPLGKKLVESIEDDIVLTLRVFNAWMEGTQAGEADGSPS